MPTTNTVTVRSAYSNDNILAAEKLAGGHKGKRPLLQALYSLN